MMKKRIIVNYSSAFGLPGERPDAGLALIHLLCSNRIKLEAIVVSGSCEDINRITVSLEWLLKFSRRQDVKVFGECTGGDEDYVAAAESRAAESLVDHLAESMTSELEKAVLLDIGRPDVLRLVSDSMSAMSDYFSEIVFWNPRPFPPQRLGVDFPAGSLDNKELAEVFKSSGCALTMLGDDTAFQTPLDMDELVQIRSVSKPLYYLLRDYLMRRAADEKSFSRDFLYKLPSAVYLTHPELFPVEDGTVKGVSLNICSHINDINAYGTVLQSSWKSWHKQEPTE